MAKSQRTVTHELRRLKHSDVVFCADWLDLMSLMSPCRLWWRMWEDHSAIPQNRLGGDSLSSRGGDGKWCRHYQDDHDCQGTQHLFNWIWLFWHLALLWLSHFGLCDSMNHTNVNGVNVLFIGFCFFFLLSSQSSFHLVGSLLWLWPLLTPMQNNNTVLEFITD